MKVRGGLVAVVVLAVIALVWWMKTPTASDVRSDDGPAAGSGHSGSGLRAAKPGATSKLDGKRVAGTVTLDGAGVAGAVVSIHRDGQPDQRTTSDAAGRFDLGTHVATAYSVVAERTGSTTEYLHVDLRSPERSDQLRIVLHGCDAAIHGTIRDASGGPVAKARVSRGLGDKGVESTDEGHYELCVPIGGGAVIVDADGYARVDESVTAYGRVRRDFELVPEAIVVGRVVRADNKQPVGGARVTISLDPDSRERGAPTTVVADDDGQFRIDGLLAGRYVVNATSDGRASREGVDVIAEVGTQEPVTCEVSPSMVVAGKVIDRESKQPISSVRVTLLLGPRSIDAVTQADGTFQLEHAFPGRYRAWLDPYELVGETITIEESTQTLVIEIEVGGSISGRVTYRGRAVDNVYVESRASFLGAITDHDGRFEIRGLTAGEHRLYVESNRIGAFTRDRVVTIAKGERRTGVELELELEGSIEGIVVDQDGRPVSGVTLELSLLRGSDFGQATTSDDGTFKARNLSGGGDYGYLVRSLDGSLKFPPLSGQRFSPIRVDNGQTHVTGVRIAIRYERLSIAGRVQTTKGKALPDVTVKAGNERGVTAASRTAEDGTFTLRDLPTGDYTVIAMTPRGRGQKADVRAGRRDVVISIPEPGAITGTVENFSGTVTVRAIANQGELRTSTSNGSFSFKGIPPDTYLLIASTSSGVRASTNVTVSEGATLVAPTLRGEGSGSVLATVVDETGNSVAGLDCVVSGNFVNKASDANGIVRIPNVGAGQGVIWCDDEKRMLGGSQSFDVLANQTAEVRVVVKRQQPKATAGFETDTRLDEFVITSIVPGGLAERAGLAIGDIVVNFAEIASTIFRGEPGATVKLVIERDDKQRTVTLTLEKP